ncbi:hypothetical protein J7T55_011784 [Diaporthe amygdali]|uniref:uncharacterized protein n=1 Tax=Phomopsis amygdali TaxID=1214568 RepID=UPI0022FF3AE9|nr:uncharacterized protein J7T55_011784 [Diaporthe amygdali]KAJ0123319.1 hypothetical protein J7T55_011784 [Diaporthe amygdali]
MRSTSDSSLWARFVSSRPFCSSAYCTQRNATQVHVTADVEMVGARLLPADATLPGSGEPPSVWNDDGSTMSQRAWHDSVIRVGKVREANFYSLAPWWKAYWADTGKKLGRIRSRTEAALSKSSAAPRRSSPKLREKHSASPTPAISTTGPPGAELYSKTSTSPSNQSPPESHRRASSSGAGISWAKFNLHHT